MSGSANAFISVGSFMIFKKILSSKLQILSWCPDCIKLYRHIQERQISNRVYQDPINIVREVFSYPVKPNFII